MSAPPRICIVTNAAISQNPRVVKEADALAGAGYDVTVVFGQDHAWTVPLDEAMAGQRRWRALSFRPSGASGLAALRGRALRARRRAFALLSRLTPRLTFAERAMGLFIPELTRLAARQEADLYIGHNPAGLVAAAWAAGRTGGRYAFDAEDFHAGQYRDTRAVPEELVWVDCIERKYLPGCCYISAASPGIARALEHRYGVPLPATLLNVFPWADRTRLDGLRIDRAARPSVPTFYWFSQVVSLDRGLQDAINALGRLTVAAELHVRGAPAPGAREALLRLAVERGVGDRLVFHDPVPPEELLSRAAEHDVGLCLEQPFTVNRDICVANKVFLHLLAGNALVVTATTGHRELLALEPDAAHVYAPGDAPGLAAILEELVMDPSRLALAKADALRAAQTRWNWETEQATLVATVKRQLPLHEPGAPARRAP